MLALFTTASLRAQDNPSETAPPPLRLTTFVDTREGYAIEVPQDWTLERTEFDGPGGSRGVLRGGTLADKSTLQVLIFQDVLADPLAGWLSAFAGSLQRIGGVDKVQTSPADAGPHAAGWVDVQASLGGATVHSWYYCVALDPTRVWVLSLARPVEDGSADRPELIRRIAGSVRVLYTPERAAELAAAVERGRKFLADGGLKTGIGQLRVDQSPRFYFIEQAGRTVGYFERRFTRAQQSLDDPRYGRADKDGLRVSERTWRFEPDGSVYYASDELFSSVDGQTDLYEITRGQLPPAGQDGRPLLTREEVIRQDDKLLSSLRTNQDLILPPPRPPLRLDDDFVGLAWQRVLPSIVGAEAGEMLGFSVYDPEARSLGTLSLQPLGPLMDEGDGEQRLAYAVRDGFSPDIARLIVDRRGHMVRLEAGDLKLRPATADEVETRYGRQRAEAFEKLNSGKP